MCIRDRCVCVCVCVCTITFTATTLYIQLPSTNCIFGNNQKYAVSFILKRKGLEINNWSTESARVSVNGSHLLVIRFPLNTSLKPYVIWCLKFTAKASAFLNGFNLPKPNNAYPRYNSKCLTGIQFNLVTGDIFLTNLSLCQFVNYYAPWVAELINYFERNRLHLLLISINNR